MLNTMEANLEETKNLTRSELRAQILASKQLKTELVDFFGQKIEVRQPPLGQALAISDEENKEAAAIDILVNHVYVPKTDEKLFDITDAEALKELPFCNDFVRVVNAFAKMANTDFLEQKNT